MLIWQLVLIQVITFVLIVVFLRWLLYNNIRRVLKRLQSLNKENLEREKTLKEEIEKAKKEAQRMIDEAKEEAGTIKEQAHEVAEKEREEIVTKSKREAKRIINEAIKDCQRKEVEFGLKMKEKMIHLAIDMIKHIFTERGRENLHKQIVDELIEEVEGIEKERMRVEGDQAQIICAIPLDAEQKKKLKKVLTSKFNKEVKLSEEIDPEITAGLIIKLERFVVDGSLKNKLKKILPLMKEQAREAL